MSFLSELTAIITALGVPVETGVFSVVPPDEYIVITPMSDIAAVSGDNRPVIDVYEARVSLMTKNNYNKRKNQIIRTLLDNGFTVTARHYAGYDNETAYHNFAVDAAKEYFFEEEDNG